MDGWNTTFRLGRSIFRGYVMFVSGRVFWRGWGLLLQYIQSGDGFFLDCLLEFFKFRVKPAGSVWNSQKCVLVWSVKPLQHLGNCVWRLLVVGDGNFAADVSWTKTCSNDSSEFNNEILQIYLSYQTGFLWIAGFLSPPLLVGEIVYQFPSLLFPSQINSLIATFSSAGHFPANKKMWWVKRKNLYYIRVLLVVQKSCTSWGR